MGRQRPCQATLAGHRDLALPENWFVDGMTGNEYKIGSRKPAQAINQSSLIAFARMTAPHRSRSSETYRSVSACVRGAWITNPRV